jgi:hypothetical protein
MHTGGNLEPQWSIPIPEYYLVRVSPKSPLCRISVVERPIDMGGLKSLEHQVNRTYPYHGPKRVRATLIVLAVVTTTTEPHECSFHAPTFRQ